MRDEDLLTSCLAELDRRSWDVDAYLAARPDLPASVQSMLRVATQVQAIPMPAPSPEFRDRVSARLAAKIAATPQRQPTRSWFLTLPARAWFRPVTAPIAASLLIIGGVGGVLTASAAAIPGSALYPTKLTAEKVQLLLAASPSSQAQVNLQIAQSRLQEAQNEIQTGNFNVVPELLQRSDQALTAAQTDVAGTASLTERSLIEQQISAVRSADQKIIPLLTPTPSERANREGGGRTVVAAPSATARSTAVISVTSKTETPKHEGSSVDGKPAIPTVIRLGDTPSTLGNPTQSEALLHRLIQQATANNPIDAITTARLYATAVQSERTNDGAIAQLNGERSQIDEALKSVPPSTRGAMLIAQEALDATLGGGSSNTAGYASALATTTAGPEIAGPTPTSVPDRSSTADKAPHANPPSSDDGNSGQPTRSRGSSVQTPSHTPVPGSGEAASATALNSEPQSTRTTSNQSADNRQGHPDTSSNGSGDQDESDKPSGNAASHSNSAASPQQTPQPSATPSHDHPTRRDSSGRRTYPQATVVGQSAPTTTAARRSQSPSGKGNQNSSQTNKGSGGRNNSHGKSPASPSSHH